MNELTWPSWEEQNQLANPTFPVMQQLKASAKGHTVFSTKGTLDCDEIDISEFVFAFLEFVQQQQQSQHQHLLQFLLLWTTPGQVFEISICLLTKRWHKVSLPGVQWMSFKLHRILSLVMLIFIPVRIQAPSLQVHASNATPLGESRKICIVLTGIIPPNALVTSLTWSTSTRITEEYVILISIPCSIVLNGDILFQLTNLLSKGHND